MSTNAGITDEEDATIAWMQNDLISDFAPVQNIAGYRFVPLQNLPTWKKRMESATRGLGLRGTILLSPEGINFFLAGTSEAMDRFCASLAEYPETRGMEVKASPSDSRPFKRLSIKIKQAIIPFAGAGPLIVGEAPRLSAVKLLDWLDRGESMVLLDVRNQYEIRQGTFDGAVGLPIEHFRDFADAARKFAQEQIAAGKKDVPVVTFCTGGIRCEKAAPFLKECGLENVVQLDGGILKYFDECGGRHYHGECFVFDDRVALRPDLLPRGMIRCELCGAHLTPEDQLAPEFIPPSSCPYCIRPSSLGGADATTDSLLELRNQSLRAITDPLPGREPYTNQRSIDVSAKFAGLTALDFLHKAFPFVGKNAWRERFDGDFLWRDGEVLKYHTIVSSGDTLTHFFPDTVEPDVDPKIEVLHEDQAIVVVAKGAPLPVHPCGRYNRNTLIHFLNKAYSPQKLRLAHRIDANTSGLVVLSRSPRFARKLQPQFERRGVEKVYLVRVLGTPNHETFTCHGKISAESLQSGARIVEPEGMSAETKFRLLQACADGTSLLEARPITGRTNQIRVHLWDRGYPICGDPMYLPNRHIGTRQSLLPDEPPMCLHAWKLRFRHPLTEKWIAFEASPPAWTGLSESQELGPAETHRLRPTSPI
jgi:UPF0176 protein